MNGILIFCILSFALIQVVCINKTNGEYLESNSNVTIEKTSGKLERSKRTLVDILWATLKIDIRLPSGDMIHLKWRKTKQLMANIQLPVDVPLADMDPNIMKKVGDFLMYQDLTQCSAVVYFEKGPSFFGVIGTDYYIMDLPFDFDDDGGYRGVPDRYVHKRDNTFTNVGSNINLPPLPSVDNVQHFAPSQNPKRPISSCDTEDDQSNKVQRTEPNMNDNKNQQELSNEIISNQFRNRRDHPLPPRYYLETLVFIASDIIEIFKMHFKNDYITWILRYYLVYFNALDMMFKKLQTKAFEMHINIAKIVMEDSLLPFDFLSNNELEFNGVVNKFSQYLETCNYKYPPDSFDYVFISTSRQIKHEFTEVPGITKYAANLYESRRLENNFYSDMPITIMQFKYHYADYLTAIQEMAKVFFMNNNPLYEVVEPTEPCCSTAQEPKFPGCLKWTDESNIQFNKYFRENLNHCFLLNKPRSLLPPGVHHLITPYTQCQCFGYDFFKKPNQRYAALKMTECSHRLQCYKTHLNTIFSELTVRPFDGSSCGIKKVCWRGRCEPLR